MSRLSKLDPERFDPIPVPDFAELAIRREIAHHERRTHALLSSDPEFAAWSEQYDAQGPRPGEDNDPF